MQPAEIQTGVVQLKQRQQRLGRLLLLSTGAGLLSAIGLAVNYDVVLSFWGLSEQVKQLHIPVTADDYLTMFGQQSDYFWNFMSWIGWLVLKVLSAFFGAFLVIHLLKKIKYFYLKFQSFVMKFVGWLIAFIGIWGSLTYVQYADEDHPQAVYAELVSYKDNIQQSAIAQHLKEAQIPVTVHDYLLAQTALLNQDNTVGQVYVNRLITAEKTDPNFQNYGFLAEQIWTMQHQVYGKAVSPTAIQINPKIEQAESIHQIVQIVLIIFLSLSLLIAGSVWTIRYNIKGRIHRINSRIS